MCIRQALLASVAMLAACAASPKTAEDAPEITGVEDLTLLERELGLVIDTPDASGNWSRGDALLKGGPCYARTVGSAAGAGWEYRRYTAGAAFFAVESTKPAAGPSRPVVCVDVDQVDEPGPYERRYTFALDGFGLDTALRYHMGSLDHGEALGFAMAGRRSANFERGSVFGTDPVVVCDRRYGAWIATGDLGTPELGAAQTTWTQCKAQGGTDDACDERSLEACKGFASAEVAHGSVDRPAWNGWDVDTIAAREGDLHVGLDGGLAYFAYLFASKDARAKDVYAVGADPVGFFQRRLEGDEGDVHWAYIGFDRLDVRHFHSSARDELLLHEKTADASSVPKARASATVYCVRRAAERSYACRGM